MFNFCLSSSIHTKILRSRGSLTSPVIDSVPVNVWKVLSFVSKNRSLWVCCGAKQHSVYPNTHTHLKPLLSVLDYALIPKISLRLLNSVPVSGSQKQELVGVISLVIPNTCRTWLHLLDTLLINSLGIKAIKKVQPHSQASTLQNMNAKVVQA